MTRKKYGFLSRILCLILSFITLTSVVNPTSALTIPGNKFDSKITLDGTQSTWAEPEILEAYTLGLTYPDIMNQFDINITRLEFCILAIKLYEKLTGLTATVGADPFTDTNNTEVLKAFKLDIVRGSSATTFSPDRTVERQEIACFIQRTIDAAGKQGVFESKGDLFPFNDTEQIAPWALAAMRFCYRNGILFGYNQMLTPLDKTPREQAIILVKRTYIMFKDTDTAGTIMVSPVNTAAVSEAEKYSTIDFAAGDLFFPAYDTRLELFVATNDKKPVSLPPTAFTVKPFAFQPELFLHIPGGIITKPGNPTDPVITPQDPGAALYTNASFTAFIDEDGNTNRWFAFNLKNANGAAKIIWQLSKAPFDGYGSATGWKSPPGLIASGEIAASAKEFKLTSAATPKKRYGISLYPSAESSIMCVLFPLIPAISPSGIPASVFQCCTGKKLSLPKTPPL